MIKDTAICIVKKVQNLPIKDAAKFALAFQDICKKLSKRQDEKLKQKELFPLSLPPPQKEPKLKFGPGRKRALTGREAADQQEANKARARRKAERLANQREMGDDRMEDAILAKSQLQNEVAATYFSLNQSANANANVADNSGHNSDSDEWVDIDDLPFIDKSSKAPQMPRIRCPPGRAQAAWDAFQPKYQAPATPSNVSNNGDYNYSL